MQEESTPLKACSRISPEVLQLSWEEKKRLCEEWQSSGLSKAAFCTPRKLALSTFHGWVSRFQSELGNQFCPIRITGESLSPTKAEPMLLEVILPNAVKARVRATEEQLSFLLKELFYAATIVR